MMASVMGRNRTPAWNGEYPRISCMNSDRKKKVANMPRVTEKATVFPAENAGILK